MESTETKTAAEPTYEQLRQKARLKFTADENIIVINFATASRRAVALVSEIFELEQDPNNAQKVDMLRAEAHCIEDLRLVLEAQLVMAESKYLDFSKEEGAKTILAAYEDFRAKQPH